MISETGRRLGPAEHMTDLFDRASTLNFTTLATVRGPISEPSLHDALRRLERRHPLLRARVARGEGGGREHSFVYGEAAPIPLCVVDGPPEAWQELAEESLRHREWSDEGPRAELTWLRHAPEHATLLLCLHHVVSDGSSGALALRDLLELLADPAREPGAVPSPGQHVLYPPGHGGWRDGARALSMLVRSMRQKKPHRLREVVAAPHEDRRVRLRRLTLDANQSHRLAQRARNDGATVHGVLCAALAQAIAAEHDGAMQQRILHPVDLRRYVQSTSPGGASVGDAVGYYVSSLETDHGVDSTVSLGPLAREITQAVRRKKAEGVPLLTAPVAGPFLARRGAKMPLLAFLELAEKNLFIGTFGVTNLGKLEALGLRPGFGALHVEDVWFVAANSVFGPLGASATSFEGALSLQLLGVEPFVSPALLERLTDRTRARLEHYSRE